MAKNDIPKMRVCGEGCIASGELDGPDGFQAQTPNGTAHWRGRGWNANSRGGWAAGQSQYVDIEKDPTRPGGRSNRTGE